MNGPEIKTNKKHHILGWEGVWRAWEEEKEWEFGLEFLIKKKKGKKSNKENISRSYTWLHVNGTAHRKGQFRGKMCHQLHGEGGTPSGN